MLRVVVATVALLTSAASAAGQEAQPQRLRLDEVVDLALKNYPAIQAAEAQTAASRAA